MSKETESLKVIIADTDLKTFEELKVLSDRYSTIFLSSDFAVNFILEYEKIDTVLISNKISNLNSIIKRTNKKRIKVFILGRDIKYPIDLMEVEKTLEIEQKRKIAEDEKNTPFLKRTFKQILSGEKRIFKNTKLNLPGYKDKTTSIKNSSKKIAREEEIKKEYENKKVSKRLKSKESSPSNIRRIGKSANYMAGNNKDGHFRNTVPEKAALNNSKFKELKQANLKIIKQKVIVLAKAKGGVGSTTIGLFLSSILKDLSILLIDLNFSEGGGDISYYLNIPKTPNILNFLDGYSRESLDNSVIRFRENLDILQPPPTFEQSKKIELQDIYCLTDIAKKKYHILIIDLPNHLGDMWLGAIDLADLLILVSDLSVGSIGRLIKINNRYLYKGLEKLLVFNMYSKQNGLDLLDSHISSFFNLDDYAVIEENGLLRKKTDFSDFEFENKPIFFDLTNKVMELLTN
ncbi:MAG: hypothetical protein K8S14_10360 [Actinomycetia bacterium]|nr:hypothetical protein [Actinomycetes bacterium]